MKKITIEEAHKLLLEIATELDKTCKANDIPYYMLGGTMIGAVRHHAIIPWDDDMDFGVPREYYGKLLSVLQAEFPKKYGIHHYSIDPSADYPWIKIDDRTTHIDDPRSAEPINKQMGVNIDVFPMDMVDGNDHAIIAKVRRLLWWQQRLFVENADRNKVKNFIKKLGRLIIPFDKQYLLKQCEKTMTNCSGTKFMGVVYGLGGDRDLLVPTDWYGTKYFDVSGLQLRGVKEYDKYLTQRYGDYMKLPPKEQWHVHADNIYQEEE